MEALFSGTRCQAKALPTQSELRALFDYCDSGALIWKVSTANNKFKPGDVAGTMKKDGYWAVKINGEPYYAHRLIWVWHKGEIPSGKVIDHINRKDSGLPHNSNKIENLQAIKPRENIFKKKLQSNNTTGLRGVCWHKRVNKWLAQYRNADKKLKHIGYYTNKFEAYEAYRKASKAVKGDFYEEDVLSPELQREYKDWLYSRDLSKISNDEICDLFLLAA